MCLTNLTLARYLSLFAEKGIKCIRFGTKDFAFFPQRFDKAFFGMLDLFHETYPTIKLDLLSHIVHPYELVCA